MARQMDLKGRHFWILSEPDGSGWRATVVEVREGSEGKRKLRRVLQVY
jgi:hypothetical protein